MEDIMENFLVKRIEQLANQSDKVAFIELDNKKEINTLTYKEIVEKSKEKSKYLGNNGMCNSVAIIFVPATIDISILEMACIYANITPIFKTISDNMEEERFEYQFQELLKAVEKVDLIITDKDRFNLKEKCLKNNINYYDYKNEGNSIFKFPIQNRENKSDLIIMTSGSTKSCKAVKLTFDNIKHCLENCKSMWELDENSINLSWAPHSHVFGLVTGFLLPMYSGAKSIIMSPKDFSNNPLSWLEIIDEYKVTNCSTTLFGIEECNRLYDKTKLKDSNLNLNSIKYIGVGGERIECDALEKFYKIYSKFNLKDKCFSTSYGMTENSGVVCSFTKDDKCWNIKLNKEDLEIGVLTEDESPNSYKVSSVGKPTKGTYIYILNKKNKILKEDRLGEIIISSPGLSMGYINEEDNTSYFDFQCPEDGEYRRFFRTGDVGAFHKGELIITGRINDVINIKGKKYSPYDIENIIINDLPYKLKSNVAFSIERKGKERVIIFQEINEKQKAQKDIIFRAIKEKIKKKMNLDVYDIVFLKRNKIPRTESKKVQRQKCKLIYEDYFYNETED